MSEYQYYEFVTLDGAISDKGMEYAESCSSRAEVSPLRWRNVYNFGDFHGSISRLLQYYDAHFYTSCWGTTRFALAFSEGLIDLDLIKPYLREDDWYEFTLSVETHKGRTIIWWKRLEEEGWDWIVGDGVIGYLAGIRNEILQGDYRSLFIGWLAGFEQSRDRDTSGEDEYIPPVPPCMESLSPAQLALIEQFPVDQDELKVAAELSMAYQSSCDTVEHVLDGLSRNEMKALLERVAAGDGTKVMTELNSQTRYTEEESCRKRMTCNEFAGKVLETRKAREKHDAEG